MPRPSTSPVRDVLSRSDDLLQLEVAIARLQQLDRLRRRLGLRWQRQIILLRRPVRVVLHLSRRPSLSLRGGPVALNLSLRGLRVTTRVARGLSYRTRTYPWPWLRAAGRRAAGGAGGGAQ